ncbi:hypothetical protein N7516_006448 [Penicillium verrucosum]|uniref:uncharacterized protein n=1 Tax=Penicillium verrucosum TaxID=60171 RepID=UPI0025455C33|nr:uncharacterized protein N7516_006448 [Penicillium verrucosum]KAJ5931959.1 hypothetical protein N7516_006448 [Penicillium verrucosum]
MSINLVPEHISYGQAFANTREPYKMLEILANNPHSLNTGIVDIEVRPVPVAIKPKGKASEGLGGYELPSERGR